MIRGFAHDSTDLCDEWSVLAQFGKKTVTIPRCLRV